jgi:hypothetical protein
LNVSVLITNYNYHQYVVEAVESALAQSFPAHEIVVVDDSSTDGSAEILTERYGQHPAVKLILRTENRGQLAALIEGTRAASGDVIALLDADDLYEPVYLERLTREYAMRPQVNFISVNLRFFGARQGLWSSRKYDADWGTSALKVWSRQISQGVPTSGNSLRRELCARAVSVPADMVGEFRTCADDCVVMGAALWGARKAYIAEPLVRYRVHDRNLWFGHAQSRPEQVRNALRTARMVEWHAAQAGLSPRALHLAHLEFKTLTEPTLGDLGFYMGLSNGAPTSLVHKSWAAASMTRHYALAFLRSKRAGAALESSDNNASTRHFTENHFPRLSVRHTAGRGVGLHDRERRHH